MLRLPLCALGLLLVPASACSEDPNPVNPPITPKPLPMGSHTLADAGNTPATGASATSKPNGPGALMPTDAGTSAGPTCSAIYDCIAACETEECEDACAEGVDEETAAQVVALAFCIQLAPCEDTSCIAEFCSEEILSCTGVELPTQPAPPTTSMDGGTSGNDCPQYTGPGTTHQGFIQADEVWAAADSPHLVTYNIDVRSGAHLTIEPCAVVKVAKGQYLEVGENSGNLATLTAKGEKRGDVERRVMFIAAESGKPWNGLMVRAKGLLDLEYAVIDEAGSADGVQSALSSSGDDNREVPIQNLRVKHVVISNSATLGFSVSASGAFTEDSTDLAANGGGAQGVRSGNLVTSYAGYIEAPAIHTLPSGNYGGNAKNAILARAPFSLTTSEQFHDRGTPYQIVGDFYMNPTSPTELTLDPGVKLMFGGPAGNVPGNFILGDVGAGHLVRLVANGTADSPIVLTSGADSPAAGDWGGIYWRGGPSTGNVMNHVVLEYGGEDSQTNGFGCGPKDNDALMFFQWEPQESFIKNCTFRNSASGGLVSGWNSDATGPDFVSSNSFSNIANGCSVSQHKPASGSCPGTGDACLHVE